MTVQEKVSVRTQHAHVSKVGRVMIVPLAAAGTAHVARVLKDSVSVILDGKVLNVIDKRHVLLLITVRQKCMDCAKQRMFVNAIQATQVWINLVCDCSFFTCTRCVLRQFCFSVSYIVCTSLEIFGTFCVYVLHQWLSDNRILVAGQKNFD